MTTTCPAHSLARRTSDASASTNRERVSTRLSQRPRPSYEGMDNTTANADSQMYVVSQQRAGLAAELGESDDEDLPVRGSRKPSPAKTATSKPGFVPAEDLPEARKVFWKIAEWVSDDFIGSIDIRQQRLGWSKPQSISFVTALVCGWQHSPPWFLHSVVSEHEGDKGHRWEVIDGCARLKALRSFTKGKIPCLDHEGKEWWFVRRAGLGQERVWGPEDQRKFNDIVLQGIYYHRLSDAQITGLTARVRPATRLLTARRTSAIASNQLPVSNHQSPVKHDVLSPPDSKWMQFAAKLVHDMPLHRCSDSSGDDLLRLILTCCANLLEAGISGAEISPPHFVDYTSLDGKDLGYDLQQLLREVFQSCESIPNKPLSGSSAHLIVRSALTVITVSKFLHVHTLEDLRADVKHIWDILKDFESDPQAFTIGCEAIRALEKNRPGRNANPGLSDSLCKAWGAENDACDRREPICEFGDENDLDCERPTRLERLPKFVEPACTECRARHHRCDRDRPACGSCLLLGITCQWNAPKEITRRRSESAHEETNRREDETASVATICRKDGLACVECRTRRRACDRNRPVCNMCETRGIACLWSDESMDVEEYGAIAVETIKRITPAKQSETTSTVRKKRKVLSTTTGPAVKKTRRSLQPNSPSQITSNPYFSRNTPRTGSRRRRSPSTRTSTFERRGSKNDTPDSVLMNDSSDEEPLAKRAEARKLFADLGYPGRAIANAGKGLGTRRHAEPILARATFKTRTQVRYQSVVPAATESSSVANVDPDSFSDDDLPLCELSGRYRRATRREANDDGMITKASVSEHQAPVRVANSGPTRTPSLSPDGTTTPPSPVENWSDLMPDQQANPAPLTEPSAAPIGENSSSATSSTAAARANLTETLSATSGLLTAASLKQDSEEAVVKREDLIPQVVVALTSQTDSALSRNDTSAQSLGSASESGHGKLAQTRSARDLSEPTADFNRLFESLRRKKLRREERERERERGRRHGETTA